VPALFELVVERGELSRARGVWHALRNAAPSAATAEERDHVHKALTALASCAWRPSLERLLNGATTSTRVEGLAELLAELGQEAVPELCELLATLSRGEHRLAVCDALTRIGRTHAEVFLPRLNDPRPNLLRGLLVVMERLGKPQLADGLAPLMGHESREVRLEAVRTFHKLKSAGPAAALVACLADEDATVRHEALRALTGGAHTVLASAWPEIVDSPAFMERAETERRMTFVALARSSGVDAVPYLRELVTRPSWLGQRAKVELGVLAAGALGEIATPAAREVLEAGKQRLQAAIRKACTQALERADRRKPGNTSGGER
jgi:HEAT repeat protein